MEQVRSQESLMYPCVVVQEGIGVLGTYQPIYNKKDALEMFPLIYHTSSLFPWEFLEKKSRMIIFCLGMYDFWQDFDFFWSCTPARYTCQSQRLSANLLNWKYVIASELGKHVSQISQITHVLFSSKLKSNKQNNIMRRFYLYWYQRQRFYLFQDIFSVELLHWVVFLLLYKS